MIFKIKILIMGLHKTFDSSEQEGPTCYTNEQEGPTSCTNEQSKSMLYFSLNKFGGVCIFRILEEMVFHHGSKSV